MPDKADFGPARREDARVIAELFQISSDGVADYVWKTLEADYPGLSLIEIGERRYARENTDFSYENCLMAKIDGRIAGMMHSYAMPAELDPVPQDIDPVLRPYAELELAGSLYISGVAMFPDYRGRGLGRAFLAHARDRAEALGLGSVSLQCFAQNPGALSLYTREGYEEVERREVVLHPFIHHTGDIILLAKAVP